MEWCAASIVYMIYIHTLKLYEVVERSGLVALSGNMKYISTIHIFSLVVCVHILY